MSLGIVLYRFNGEFSGEISVSENQPVTILTQHEDGWTTVRATNENDEEVEGLVPSAYIKVVNFERRLPPKPPRKHSSLSGLSMIHGGLEEGVAPGAPGSTASTESEINAFGDTTKDLERLKLIGFLSNESSQGTPSASANKCDGESDGGTDTETSHGNNGAHSGGSGSLASGVTSSSLTNSWRQPLSAKFGQDALFQSLLTKTYLQSMQSSLENVNKTELRTIENAIVSCQRRAKWKALWAKGETFKRRRTRISLIKETISTEETYVNSLKLCMKVFSQLKGSETLLKGMQEIIQVNEELLARLKLELENFPMTFIGRVFKEIIPKMVVYTDYINNYDKSFENYQQWVISNKKYFATQLNKLYKKYQNDLGGKQFESYLILPVQRIPRYRMLLESILKNTEEDHIEYQDIKDALEDVMQLASFIENQKKQTEDSEVMRTLNRIISEYSPYKGTTNNTRSLIRDGILNVSCPARGINPGKFRCHLLSDLLVFTDVIDPSVKKKNGRVEFAFLLVSKIVEETTNGFTIETFHTNQSIQISFSSDIQGDCGLWCKDLRSALASCEALFQLYEYEDDFAKLASERQLLQDESVDSMKEFSDAKIKYSATDKECNFLHQRIVEHEDELRALQEIINQEKRELEEIKNRKEELSKRCNYYSDRITNCIESIRERDQIFLSLLRNETDSFRIIFDDTPSDTGMLDSPSKRNSSSEQTALSQRLRSASFWK